MMYDTDARLDRLEEAIKKPSFRQNRGLSNEVGYYIFDYPESDELIVRERIDYIRQKNKTADDYVIQVFDLYDIMIEILKEKGLLEKCFELEAKSGFEKISRNIANRLQVNSTNSLFIKYIEERLQERSIIFITGIGKCYPIVRSHTVLNNLTMVIDNVPVVMFYPGKYSGQQLTLFNEIFDDNYYRAFKIVE